jgi:hypothetical protein
MFRCQIEGIVFLLEAVANLDFVIPPWTSFGYTLPLQFRGSLIIK